MGSSLGASTDPGEEPVEPPEIRDEVCQPEELGAEFGLPQPEAEAEPIAVDTEQEVDAATGEQTIDEPEEGHELLARLSELKASIETAEAEMDRVEQLLRSEIGGLREKLRALGDELGSM